MSSLIPQLQSSDPAPASEPRVIALEGSEVDDVFETLSSNTRRIILKRLYEAPATPSELAEATDTSLQNVHYHIDKLSEVDLIEAIDTRYSQKGKEMRVFAPSNDPLIFVESEETRSRVESSLDRIVGILSLLAIGSLLVQAIAGWLERPESMTVKTESLDQAMTASAAKSGPDMLAQVQNALLEPGALVFMGGLIVLLGFVVVRRMAW